MACQGLNPGWPPGRQMPYSIAIICCMLLLWPQRCFLNRHLFLTYALPLAFAAQKFIFLLEMEEMISGAYGSSVLH